MKMNACSLIGQFVNSVLIEFNGNYDLWLSKMISIYFHKSNDLHAAAAFNSIRLENVIDHLMRFIKFDDQSITNNMCKRSALR